MISKYNLIIDFDSTIIELETLEYIAQIALDNKPNKQDIISKIADLTNKAMNGHISFQDSLQLRFKELNIHKEHIELTIKGLKNHIDKSFIDNIDFIKNNINQIFIVSGGFQEIIYPVINSVAELDWQVYANSLVFNNQGYIEGVDSNNPLAHSNGKVEMVRILNPDSKNDIIAIGDGYTDYEIKKMGAAKFFLAYIGHVKRENVYQKADHLCYNFIDVIDFLKNNNN